ncbi:MAG: trypsin-like peptidase domain-containing protein [Dehalococcoidia bacterium]|nr:trypsin-like peptidase domain-containing protein [Dehalococcoidia bacterium]
MPVHLRRGIGSLLLMSAAVVGTGCARAADFIPGDRNQAQATPRPTPPPILAPPILPPARLQLGERTTTSALNVSDAELAGSVVRLEARQGTNLLRVGTGVVVDQQQRLILTSYQIVEPYAGDGSRAYGSLEVAVTRAVGEAATSTYLAQVVRAEPALGLAVVRATKRIDGAALAPGEFDLPAAPLGDSARATRGDAVRILGYPGMEEVNPESGRLVASEGSVLGFRGDTGIPGVAWIKTQARVPSGQNGAPVFDQRGRVLGLMLQGSYTPTAPAGQTRPVALATRLIDEARQAGPEASYVAPLFRRPAYSPGPIISRPVFAENALEGASGDLFDYTESYPDTLSTLHYEFLVQGATPGVIIDERWYLNGVLQDGLSSSVPWAMSQFEVVTDRLRAPSGRTLQAGVWRLELWAENQQRAAAEVYVGSSTSTRSRGTVSDFQVGATANIEGKIKDSARATSNQVVFSFNYANAAGVHQLKWTVFRDGRAVYTSPIVPWEGGTSGTWWVGYSPGTAIGAGTWEVEVQFDGQVVGSDGAKVF